jgi:hypothetical protein
MVSAAAPHLYIRGNIFYYRVVIPDRFRSSIGRREIRISLETPYRREALGHGVGFAPMHVQRVLV